MFVTATRTFFVFVLAIACSSGAREARRASTPQRETPRASTPQPRFFAGQVTHADDHPASGAIVIVSDPSDGKNLAVAVTRGDGHFETTLPPGRYALTATDASAFVYLPAVEPAADEVSIRLGKACHPFTGRLDVESSIARGAIVKLSRKSELNGDTFGALVAADGAFHACLPDATYTVIPPPEYASRLSWVTIPTATNVTYRTAPLEIANQVPPDMSGLRPRSAAEFVKNFPATIKVLGLGESNHGTREFYEERTSLVLSLAKEQGVRLLLFEAGYGEVIALDDYINGASIDVAHAVQDLGYWTYDTKTFLETLRRIREYNAKQATSQRIHIVGIDVQNTRGCVQFITKHAGSAISSRVADSLTKLVPDSGKAWATLTAEERRTVREALHGLATLPAGGSASSQSSRLMLAAKALLLRLDLIEAPSASGPVLRDAGMAQMVLDVLATAPDSRATLWAHLGHVAREYLVGEETMGSHLASALRDGYQVYGLVAVKGTARAWDAAQQVGVVAQPLRSVPVASLESVLSSRSAEAHVTYWTFADASGDAAHWLRGVHPLRSFGAVFMGESEISYWDLGSFDGAILFDTVSPTEPTPTGERHAKPKTP